MDNDKNVVNIEYNQLLETKKLKIIIKCFFILLSCVGIIYISNLLNIDWLKNDYYSLNDAAILFLKDMFSFKIGSGYSILIKSLFRAFTATYIVLFGVVSIIEETICILVIAYEKIKSKKYKHIIYTIGMIVLLGILTYAYIIQVYPFLIIIKDFIKIVVIIFFIMIPFVLYFGILHSLGK